MFRMGVSNQMINCWRLMVNVFSIRQTRRPLEYCVSPFKRISAPLVMQRSSWLGRKMELLTPKCSRITMPLQHWRQRNKDRRLRFTRNQQHCNRNRTMVKFLVHVACTICRTMKQLTVLRRLESRLLPKIPCFLQPPWMEIMIFPTELVLRSKGRKWVMHCFVTVRNSSLEVERCHF